MEEILTIAEFVRTSNVSDSIADMEQSLNRAIGYGQRVGEMLNEAQAALAKKRAGFIAELERQEDETETTRKAKLEGAVCEDQKLVADLKNLKTHLREKKMMFMQAIKTRREEPH